MNKTLTILMSLSLAACPAEAPKGNNGGDDPTFSPASGSYTLTLSSVDDACNLNFDDEPSIVDLDVEAGTLTEDGGTTWACDVDGATVSCTNDDSFDGSGFDFVVSIAAEMVFTFSDADTAAVDGSFDLSCTGSECGLYEAEAGVTLPCTTTVVADAVGG